MPNHIQTRTIVSRDIGVVPAVYKSVHCCEIIPGKLYMGDIYSCVSAVRTMIMGVNIKRVISLGNVGAKYPTFDDVSYYRIVVKDDISQNISEYFESCYKFIEEDDGAVLVHSMNGNSRCATIIAAYLIKKLGMTTESALALIQEKRMSVGTNEGFLEQLRKYEIQNSVL